MTPKRVLVCGGRDLDAMLRRIAKALLKRPSGRRGGYVMTDEWLRAQIGRRARSAGIEVKESPPHNP